MEFYTYIWRDANGVPFYVGKGKGRRFRQISKRSAEFRAIHGQGGCQVEIVDWFIHESQAHAHEVELIALYGRRDMGGLLVNKTDGGDGVCGAIRTPEHNAKIGASRVGKPRPDWLKEHLRALKVGVPLSDEHRMAISRGQIGKPVSESTRAKKRAARLGVKLGPLNADALAASTSSVRNRPPSSGFKGVRLNDVSGRFQARIKIDGKERHLKTHATAEEAARAYDRAAIEAWGYGNCYLNFPDEASAA